MVYLHFIFVISFAELRDQLDKVEEVVALIPPLVIREYLSTATLTLEQDKQRADGEFDVKLLELEKIRVCTTYYGWFRKKMTFLKYRTIKY
jgi:hypothetical protein